MPTGIITGSAARRTGMGDTCPHCGTRLPLLRDAFCPDCRQSLEQESPTPDGAPPRVRWGVAKTKDTARYILAAVGLGAAWCAVLTPFSGDVLLGGEMWFVNLSAMCSASLSVALLFRRFIVRAEGLGFHALAVGLPPVGAFLFGVYLVLGWWLHAALTCPGRGIDWHDAVKLPFLFVLYGACLLCFISLPMGYLSQWLMQRAGEPGRTRAAPDRC
jgi:hypothetical protein